MQTIIIVVVSVSINVVKKPYNPDYRICEHGVTLKNNYIGQ